MSFGFLWPNSSKDFDDSIEKILDEGPEITLNENGEYNKIEYFPVDEDIHNPKYATGSAPTLRPVYGSISSRFGYRRALFSKYNTFHRGIDIVAPLGTNIYAAGDGVVEFSGYRGAYGYTVIINHKNGYTTLYAHCKNLLVQKNQYVKRGDIIATVGNTGSATGTHLHYEVRKNGFNMNPEHYFVALPSEARALRAAALSK